MATIPSSFVHPHSTVPAPPLTWGFTLIIACCTDLIFATKIRGTAEQVGVPFRSANTVAAVTDRLDRIDDGRLNEPITGVLVDLDLGDVAISIIETCKAKSPAVPVIAFGSHVAVDVLNAARSRGADKVMPRSQFAAQLPQLLAMHGGAEL